MPKFTIKEIMFQDPFSVYALFKDIPESAFLDSANQDTKLSRYSFIGLNPFSRFEFRSNSCILNDQIIDGDPFEVLQIELEKYSIEVSSRLPFVAGCIGFFSYDMGMKLQNVPHESSHDFSIPDCRFLFYDHLIIFDLKEQRSYLTSMGMTDHDSDEIERKIRKAFPIEVNQTNMVTPFFSNFDKKAYLQAVDRIQEYIRSGDTYIMNMTRQIWCTSIRDSFDIYAHLRTINGAPFAFYAFYPDFQIISSSPERFFNIENDIITTRPIKGTRPRGGTKKEDCRNKKELLCSEKDKSELLMVVDLERNDLNKVCAPNSVKVPELFTLETYPTVFHLVATVTGQLENGKTALRAMKACFPGGSITGTPKKRTMEIIEELETVPRGLYTGTFGYFDFRGNCDFNMIIRTIVKQDGKAFFGVGGGITIESDSISEWNETQDKAKALQQVLW